MARIKELMSGIGAHSVIEAVGTQESMMQAIRSTRPGGHVGYVGVAHDVELPGDELSSLTSICTAAPPQFAASFPSSSTSSGPRDRSREDLRPSLPHEEVAEGYRAMDERRAIKALLRP